MRKRVMEITIGLILIAILFLGLAILWLIYIEKPRRESERYQSELKAEADLLSRVKPVIHNGVIMLPVLIDGDLKWQRQDATAQQAQSTPQAAALDQSVHNDAVDLVSASIDITNPDRKPHQLMTADECQAHGVLGGDRDRRQAAVKYLVDQFDVMAISDQGPKKNGVYYNGGTLKKLITDMAVKSRPRPGSRAAYDESQQNLGTL